MGSRNLLPKAAALLAGVGLHVHAALDREPERYRFGEVFQGALVEHEFELRNDSDRAMRISGVRMSPPITIGRMPAVIAAHATTAIRTKLDTSKLRGDYAGTLVVTLDDPGVVEREFRIEGRITPSIELLPHPAFFLSTTKGTEKTASIEIVNREHEPVDVEIATRPARYEVALDAIEPGRRFRVSLSVPADAPAGRTTERLTLKTSNPRKPVVNVGVNVLVKERVHTFPESVDLGTLRLRELASSDSPRNVHSQTLMIYQAGGTQFKVDASTDVAGLAILAEPGPAGDRVQLTLSLLREKSGPGPVEGTLVLKTNDPEFPQLRVPVSGRILE